MKKIVVRKDSVVSAQMPGVLNADASIPTLSTSGLPSTISTITEIGSASVDYLPAEASEAFIMGSYLEDSLAIGELFAASSAIGSSEQTNIVDNIALRLDTHPVDSQTLSESIAIQADLAPILDTTTLSEELRVLINKLVQEENVAVSEVFNAAVDKIAEDQTIAGEFFAASNVIVTEDTATLSESLSLTMDASLIDSPVVSELVKAFITISLTDTVTVSDDLFGMVFVVYTPPDDSMSISDSISITLSPYLEDTSLISEEVVSSAGKGIDESSSVNDLGIIVKQSYFLSEYTVGHRYTGTVTNF